MALLKTALIWIGFVWVVFIAVITWGFTMISKQAREREAQMDRDEAEGEE